MIVSCLSPGLMTIGMTRLWQKMLEEMRGAGVEPNVVTYATLMEQLTFRNDILET
jgi:hypothetical protein